MNKLMKEAIKASKRAYSPYSKLKVGAALEAANGKIYTGCNIENASFAVTVCAERVALFKAISEGNKKIKKLALVVGGKGAATPCGMCRQALAEFNPELSVLLSDSKGNLKETSLSKLFPGGFTLKKS